MVHRALLVSVTTFYGATTLPGASQFTKNRAHVTAAACFLCCISPLLMDDSAVMGIVGMGGPMDDYGYGGDFDMTRAPGVSPQKEVRARGRDRRGLAGSRRWATRCCSSAASSASGSTR
jgi:hypothetical protein